MSEILRFDTNVPVEVALRFGDGKHVEGRYGDQVMYSLEDERIIYVPPIVERKIQELQIAKGERFEICKAEVKKGNRRAIEWRVSRIVPQVEEIPQQPVVRPAAAVSIPDYQNASNNGNGNTGNGHGQVNSIAKANGTSASEIATGSCFAEMDQTFTAAVEIAQRAESHAAGRNYSLRFSSEDVRAIALSLFIARTREGGVR